MRISRSTRARALALFVAAAGVAHADFNDGVVAYAMGDYERALQTLRPLAETANHAYAQYYLGDMYANGKGVPQDHKEAARWYRSAAEKGIAAAQAKLGQLYAEGLGVPKDGEFAFAWFSVAAKLGNARAAELMESTRTKLSPKEFAEAQELAGEYLEKYGKPPQTAAPTPQ
jgi:hypothetical protein